MGSVDKVDANHGILGTKDIRIDLAQLFTAQVIITIAGGGLEIGIGHSMLLEGRKDLLGVEVRDLINAGKLLGQSCLGLDTNGTDVVADL